MKPDRAVWLACLATLVTVALLLSCASLAGGDVTETGNGLISGRVVDTLGSGVHNVRVQLLPAHYNPLADPALPDSVTALTDATGFYTVKAPGPGDYCLEGADGNSTCKTLVTGITVVEKDRITVPESVLRRTGAITIMLLDTLNDASGYVYLPGTTCYARVRSGIASVDAVPVGTIPAVNYANIAMPARNHVIQTSVTVLTNDTLAIADTGGWKYSRRFFFNTTATGAGVEKDVYNFPVLVRLMSVNFDFNQAKADGSDIRFLKSNRIPLPYEIEQWDPVTGLAEVWVKVDTVYGNSSRQSILMCWGNENAASQSNGPEVFDTANGFQGVWHLSEAGTSMVNDATANHFDGTPSDTAPASVEGAIGRSRSFNGLSNGIRMNGTASGKLNYPENGTYTVSARAYADTLDNGYHMVAGKGNEQYFIGIKRSVPDTTMRWEFVEYHDKTGWSITEDYPSAKTWTHLVGIRRGTSQYLYVNGVLVDSSIFISAATAPRNADDDFTIGKLVTTPAYTFEGKCPFLGKIDEVRVSNINRSADWIKLCYMNQKEEDALVKFE